LRAGRLRHIVTIQRVTETQDGYGDKSEAWADVADLRAGIEPLRGREFFDAQHVSADVTTKIVIRYYSGIVPKMRVINGSRIWEIKSVIDPDERHRELQLMCTEVV